MDVIVYLIHVANVFVFYPVVVQQSLNAVVYTLKVLEFKVESFIFFYTVHENLISELLGINEIIVRANECSFDALQRKGLAFGVSYFSRLDL